MLLAQAVENGRRTRLRRKVSAWMVELGTENADAKSEVYLMTFARVLADRLQSGDLREVALASKVCWMLC